MLLIPCQQIYKFLLHFFFRQDNFSKYYNIHIETYFQEVATNKRFQKKISASLILARREKSLTKEEHPKNEEAQKEEEIEIEKANMNATYISGIILIGELIFVFTCVYF